MGASSAQMILRTTQPSLSTVFSAEIEPEEVVGEDGKRTSAAREVEKYIAELSLAEVRTSSNVIHLKSTVNQSIVARTNYRQLAYFVCN